MKPGKIFNPTPLGIVAAFVSLTEGVAMYAVTKVDGAVQGWLTVFVILYALLIAGAFFAILWFRPYVFYPPSEFGNAGPKSFVEAMHGIPTEVSKAIAKVEAEPDDPTSKLELIDSLLDDANRQHLILIGQKDIRLPLDSRLNFETGNEHQNISGTGSAGKIAEDLGGTGLIEVDPKTLSLGLTPFGKSFVEWLINHGRKFTYYESNVGGWGDRKEVRRTSVPHDPAQLQPLIS